MRLTLVMAGNEEGGLEKHVIELANGLAARQHQVCLIAHPKYANRVVAAVEFKAVYLDKSRRNIIVLWQLYQAIKQSRPDVLHVHANKAAAMIAPLLKWLHIPSVASAHNIKAKAAVFSQFSHIIAVSSRVAAQFDDLSRVSVVLNGVSAQQLGEPVSKRWDPQQVQAIAVGRLVDAKGFDLLIEAWQGIDAKLWIVGSGDLQADLQQRIERYSLTQQVQLCGHRDDVSSLIRAADFFVISSRSEGGPYTLAEALLLQRPVLSTDVGMVAEIVPADFIVETNNVDALHQLIQRQLAQPNALQDAFQPVYHTALQHLTLDAMLTHTLAVYQRLLS